MTTPDSIITALEAAPSIIIPLVQEMPEARRKRRPKPAKWSAHEHACHLSVVHSLFWERLELMLTHEHPKIISYSPDKDEPDALLKLNLAEELTRFAAERQRLVARLRQLSPADWERTADHEEYRHYSVFVMFRHVALHDMLHGYRIEELALAKD